MNPLGLMDVGTLCNYKSIIEKYADTADGDEEKLRELIRSEAAGGSVIDGEFALDLDNRDILDAEWADAVVPSIDIVTTVYKVYNVCSYSVPFRVYNAPSQQIRHLSPSDNWSVRTLDARVSYTQQSKEMITSIDFTCTHCDNTFTQEQKIYTSDVETPDYCPHCEASFKGYRVEDSEHFIESQRIILEDLPEDGNDDIVVYLHGDFVNSVEAGSRVELTGVVALLIEDESTDVERAIVALGVEGRDLRQKDTLTEEEREWCAEQLESGAVEDLVASIAPNIIGRDDIKRGILHSVVSGANDALDCERTDSHLFLIGEPSTGKSKLLHWISENIQGTERASSEGATGVGLTGAVQRDERLNGEWVLHPGVLSRVNRGVAVVDELDKLAEEDLNRLYSALASGEIDINKATIDATLPSETTLVAAANPEHGDFDLYADNIDDQFDFPSPLIRRFDLIYPVLRDDVDMDKEYARTQTSRFGSSGSPSENAPYTPSEVAMLVRYARSIDVVLSEEAEEMASEVWEKVQEGAKSDDMQWLDSRRFEGLLRLSLASARLHGREEANEDDVAEALKLMKDAFSEFVANGTFDLDLETGQSETLMEVRKTVRDVVSSESTEPDVDGVVAMVTVELDVDEEVVRSEVDEMLAEDEIWVGDDDVVRLAE
jgi:replicative DNA helicase Mcm